MPKHRGLLSRLLSSRPKDPSVSAGNRVRGICCDEGATLVEFALASTFMLTMLFGVLETSLAVYSYDFVSEAAREATRYAIVRGTKCTSMPDCLATKDNIQSHVRAMNYPGINTNNLTTTTSWYTAGTPPSMTWTLCASGTPSACAVEGNAVKVVVNYPFTLSVPFLKPLTINMSNSSMMVISQ